MSTDRACLPTHLVGSLPRDAYPNTLHHPVTLSRPAGALHHRVRLTRGGAVWREQRPAVGVGQQLASAAGCALSQCGAPCMSHEPHSTKHAPCNMQACMGHCNIATLQRAASRCMVHGVQRHAATCIRQHATRRMHRDCSWWFAVSGPSARTGLRLQGSARLPMSLSPQSTGSSARCKCAEYPYPPGPTAASLMARNHMRAPTNMDVRSLSHSTCASMRAQACARKRARASVRAHARTHASR